MNKLARLVPPTLVSVAFLLAFVFYYAKGMMLLGDYDTPWHIAAGNEIRATGHIPYFNEHSFADHARWYNISWSWDALISFITEKTGLHGLYLFTQAFGAFVIGLLGLSLMARRQFSENAIIPVLAVAALCIWHNLYARPQLFSYVMALAFYYVLHSSREAGKQGWLWLLPPLMALWANVHGGFIAGFTLFAAYGVEAFMGGRMEWLKRLIIIGVICLFAIFLTPLGIEMVTAVLRTMHSNITSYITEWYPYHFGLYSGIDLFLLVCLLAIDPKSQRVHLADKLLCFLWVVLAMQSVRNFSIAVLLSAPMLAAGLERLLPEKQRGKTMDDSRRGAVLLATLGATALLMYLPLHSWFKANPVVDPAVVPQAELEFVKKNYPDTHFLNDYQFGGYMMYFNQGTPKVFVDGRAGTAYSEKLLGDFIAFVSKDEEAAREVIKRHNIEGLILAKKSSAVHVPDFPEAYKKVFEGEAAEVYIRRTDKGK